MHGAVFHQVRRISVEAEGRKVKNSRVMSSGTFSSLEIFEVRSSMELVNVPMVALESSIVA